MNEMLYTQNYLKTAPRVRKAHSKQPAAIDNMPALMPNLQQFLPSYYIYTYSYILMRR